jgi:hypothetical protein
MSGRCRLLCCYNSRALEQDCADIDSISKCRAISRRCDYESPARKDVTFIGYATGGLGSLYGRRHDCVQ